MFALYTTSDSRSDPKSDCKPRFRTDFRSGFRSEIRSELEFDIEPAEGMREPIQLDRRHLRRKDVAWMHTIYALQRLLLEAVQPRVVEMVLPVYQRI